MDPEQVKRSSAEARAVVRFWFEETKPSKWFSGGPSFDADIRRRFSAHHAAASAGLLDQWRSTPKGALALLLILDQFSRNLFRRDGRAFAADPYARLVAGKAIARRFDMVSPAPARPFFYLPFMHAENIGDQDRSVALFTARLPASDNLRFAIDHQATIRRFSRFPHRNEALGRRSTAEERGFIARRGRRG